MVLDAETADSAWRGIYRVGGVTALIAGALLPIEVTIFAVGGRHCATGDAFALSHDNRLLGLLEFKYNDYPATGRYAPRLVTTFQLNAEAK